MSQLSFVREVCTCVKRSRQHCLARNAAAPERDDVETFRQNRAFAARSASYAVDSSAEGAPAEARVDAAVRAAAAAAAAARAAAAAAATSVLDDIEAFRQNGPYTPKLSGKLRIPVVNDGQSETDGGV